MSSSLYEERGWAVVPICAGEKRAVVKNWNSRVFRIGDIDPDANVGIRWGADSGGLVDVDLDCAEAIELAPIYVPPTGAVFGRPSKPKSHLLYVASGAVFEPFGDPIAGDTLLELRADDRTGGRHQTIVPPSVADGEERQWVGDAIEPSIVVASVLRQRCVRLAIGCLVMRYVGEAPAKTPMAPGWDHARLLWECDHDLGRRAYHWLDQPAPDTPRWHPKPIRDRSPVEGELHELARAILNNHAWEEWNKLGMAFFAASDGSEEGFCAFDLFSAKNRKYDPRETLARWENYRRSPPTQIGMGTLIHYARQAGWRPGRAA